MLQKNKNMKYEITGNQQASRGTDKRLAIKTASELHTGVLVWILVKRHKIVLLSVGNCVLALNFLVPSWFDIIRSII
jgi:hypothetical protein